MTSYSPTSLLAGFGRAPVAVATAISTACGRLPRTTATTLFIGSAIAAAGLTPEIAARVFGRGDALPNDPRPVHPPRRPVPVAPRPAPAPAPAPAIVQAPQPAPNNSGQGVIAGTVIPQPGGTSYAAPIMPPASFSVPMHPIPGPRGDVTEAVPHKEHRHRPPEGRSVGEDHPREAYRYGSPSEGYDRRGTTTEHPAGQSRYGYGYSPYASSDLPSRSPYASGDLPRRSTYATGDLPNRVMPQSGYSYSRQPFGGFPNLFGGRSGFGGLPFFQPGGGGGFHPGGGFRFGGGFGGGSRGFGGFHGGRR